MTIWRIFHTHDSDDPRWRNGGRGVRCNEVFVTEVEGPTHLLEHALGLEDLDLFAWGYNGTGPQSLAKAMVLDLRRALAPLPQIRWTPGLVSGRSKEAWRVYNGLIQFLPRREPWWLPSSVVTDFASGTVIACSHCGHPTKAATTASHKMTIDCRCGQINWNYEASELDESEPGEPVDQHSLRLGVAKLRRARPNPADDQLGSDQHWIELCNQLFQEGSSQSGSEVVDEQMLALFKRYFFAGGRPITSGRWPGPSWVQRLADGDGAV